jgi:hypothetical protein
MINLNANRRAIGVLAIFVTIITVVAIWNLPQTERNAVEPI